MVSKKQASRREFVCANRVDRNDPERLPLTKADRKPKTDAGVFSSGPSNLGESEGVPCGKCNAMPWG